MLHKALPTKKKIMRHNLRVTKIVHTTQALVSNKTNPCIRLERGKFESTNQDSAGGKISSVLM